MKPIPEIKANARLVPFELYEIAKQLDELDDGDELFCWKHQELFQRLHSIITTIETGEYV